MPSLQTIRWIASPVETVFTCIRNPHVYAQWLPNVRAVRWPSSGVLAIGETGVVRAGHRDLRLRSCGYIENRMLELELRGSGYLTRERIELEPAMGGTRVIHITEITTSTARSTPLQRRLPPTRKMFDDIVGALKRALEAAERYPTQPYLNN